MSETSTKNLQLDIIDPQNSWLRGWFRWCPTSMALLWAAEKRILSSLKTSVRGKYVDIGSGIGNKENKIWTLCLNEDSDKIPLVMLHGLCSGVGLWCLNLDAFAAKRPVYAIDLLGFGRSSRPAFSSNNQEAENQLVQSLEDWRKQMRLDNFILFGHSFGGYLATAYCLKYPKRISHLILAEPWGFPENSVDFLQHHQIPFWAKAVIYALQPLNPLWGLRAAGPWGPKMVERFRPDIICKFSAVVEQHSIDIPDYIYHCNAQNPSGESAFHAMMKYYLWAKLPMINRVSHLYRNIPLTFIYGSRSWMDQTGWQVQKIRQGSYVDVQVIHGAGHHVYADKHEEFNKTVIKTCDIVDDKELQLKKIPSDAAAFHSAAKD